MECIVEGAGKFWEAWVEDSTFFSRYGKIGAKGTTAEKKFDAQEDALRHLQKQIQAKTKKGYGNAEAPAAVVAAAAPSPSKKAKKLAPAAAKKAPAKEEKESESATTDVTAAEDEKKKKKPVAASKKTATKKTKAAPVAKKGSTKDEKTVPAVEEDSNKPMENKVYLVAAGAKEGSEKFWEAWTSGSTFFSRFGKVGNNGKAKPKEFPSLDKALSWLGKQRAAKEKKGYVIREAAA